MTSGRLSLVLLSMIMITAASFLMQLQPVYATFPGANGKIVFTRNIGTLESPQYEIFTVNPDGSGLTQLTFIGQIVSARANLITGDIALANDFRVTEDQKHGIAFKNDAGEKIAVLDRQGNLRIKGDVIKDPTL